jgi:hypothetical protein
MLGMMLSGAEVGAISLVYVLERFIFGGSGLPSSITGDQAFKRSKSIGSSDKI